MSIVETYLFLFIDSFITGLVLPAKQDLVFTAMRMFGGYNFYFAAFISTIGITIAACLNWCLGRILRTLKKFQHDTNEASPKFEKILGYLNTYGYWTALLGFVPVLGPIIIVFTGLVQTSFIRVIALAFLTNLLWHWLLII